MSTPRGIAVVGAGLGGLATACTLAARGHRVTLFERNEWAGGKAAVLETGGFRFDMGPTILTVFNIGEGTLFPFFAFSRDWFSQFCSPVIRS